LRRLSLGLSRRPEILIHALVSHLLFLEVLRQGNRLETVNSRSGQQNRVLLVFIDCVNRDLVDALLLARRRERVQSLAVEEVCLLLGAAACSDVLSLSRSSRPTV